MFEDIRDYLSATLRRRHNHGRSYALQQMLLMVAYETEYQSLKMNNLTTKVVLANGTAMRDYTGQIEHVDRYIYLRHSDIQHSPDSSASSMATLKPT